MAEDDSVKTLLQIFRVTTDLNTHHHIHSDTAFSGNEIIYCRLKKVLWKFVMKLVPTKLQ